MPEKFDIHRLYRSKDLDELRTAYDEWAEGYDKEITEGFGWEGPQRLVAAAAPHMTRHEPILDAGAGSGLVGVALVAAGFTNIDAMDLSIGMLEKAQQKGIYRDVLAAALGDRLDYADDTYQAVLAAGVFTPGHAPPTSFVELTRITRPGGIIAFTLRHDLPPEGFHETMKEHAATGLWSLVSSGEPWQSLARGEPEVHHAIWIWRVA